MDTIEINKYVRIRDYEKKHLEQKQYEQKQYEQRQLRNYEQKQLDEGITNNERILTDSIRGQETKRRAYAMRDKKNELRKVCVSLTDGKAVKLTKPYLIGINGKIGCGKTTAVEYLAANYGFTEYMFANPLKQIALLLGFEEKEVFGTQEEKLAINKFWGISGRQFLQVFGSEVCRDFVPKALPDMNFNGLTMWVRLFEKYYTENKDKAIAVSDVRFEDESNTVKQFGGYIVRIERDTSDAESNSETNVNRHISETQKDKIEPRVIIRNNGSIADLYCKLDQLVVMINQGFLEVPSTVIYM